MAKEPKTEPKGEKADEKEADEKSPEEILKQKKEEAKHPPAGGKKAGPKSARAKGEADEPETKKEKKAKAEAKPKAVQVARDPLAKRGKKYKEAIKQLDKAKEYELEEAISLAQQTSYAKFDAAVELHVNLGVDPKQADQMVRGTVGLPHGSGKSQRVGVVASADKAKEAKDAGADVVGDDDLLEKIGKGQFDFDILVATPDMMAKLGKHAKELGPKGLMPNPKSGTVTDDVAKTVKELKSGRVEFRIDAQGIIHAVIGKVSFKPEQLLENCKTLLKAINAARPAAIKGSYFEKLTLTTTMGPGIKLSIADALRD